MARDINQVLAEARAFISANPGMFQGLDPRNITAHLGVVAPDLWNQLQESLGTNPNATDIGNSLLPPPPPNVAGPTTVAPPNTTEADIQTETAKRTTAALQQKLDELFGTAETGITNRINKNYADTRSKAVAEEAALGRLDSPNSIIPLSKVDDSRNMALSDAIGQLASSKATGQLDVSKAIEGILQSQRQADQSGKEFGQTLDFNKSVLNNSITQNDLDRALKERLAKAGINANQTDKDPGTLDYLNASLNGLNSLTSSAKNLSDIFNPKGK